MSYHFEFILYILVKNIAVGQFGRIQDTVIDIIIRSSVWFQKQLAQGQACPIFSLMQLLVPRLLRDDLATSLYARHTAIHTVACHGVVEHSRYVFMVSSHYRMRTWAIESSMGDETYTGGYTCLPANLYTKQHIHRLRTRSNCVLHSQEGGELYPHNTNSKFNCNVFGTF